MVIALGAFVRLSDAGLGCPDWPGCYGKITWPTAAEEVASANAAFPDRPVEQDKAWKEMVHRYLAAGLGFLILVMAVIALVRRQRINQPVILPLFLLALVIFQGMLGMWTVTLKLKPIIVMAHLLGGMTTFALLVWLYLRTRPGPEYATAMPARPYRWLVLAGLAVLTAQISLGGWVSSNYAALACLDFPTCLGSYSPPADYAEGFVLWREVGVDYEGGILDHPARVAVHWAHRVGALVTAAVLAGIAVLGWARYRRLKPPAIAVLAVLALQLTLGIFNVVLLLPLANAVAHNAAAALLLAAMVWLLHRSVPR